jgi:hypothetical protein
MGPRTVFKYKCRICGSWIIKRAGRWTGLGSGSPLCYPAKPEYRHLKHVPE